MSKKFKYYDIRNTLKKYPDAYYYLVIGERSNGKTYSSLDYALERYFECGEQFAYIRRYGEDIRKKHLSNLFSGHIESIFSFIILKRPNTDCLFSVVVDGAVLGHRSTCDLGIGVLNGTPQDHQG